MVSRCQALLLVHKQERGGGRRGTGSRDAATAMAKQRLTPARLPARPLGGGAVDGLEADLATSQAAVTACRVQLDRAEGDLRAAEERNTQ